MIAISGTGRTRLRLVPAIVASGVLMCVVGAAIMWSHWDPIERDLLFSANAATATPSSITPLLGKNAAAALGDMVYLNNVLLQAGPKPNIFVISGAHKAEMLIVSDLPTSLAGRTPITVDIKGLIRRLPSRTTLRRSWKLSTDQVHAFEKQQIYIAAESVTAQPTPAD